jgi:hypothetical protein
MDAFKITQINIKKRSVLTDLLCTFFILLFIYAALAKVLDFEKFRVELGKSPVLNAFAFPVSILIPLLEVIIAIMLAIRRFQYFGLYLAFSLMVMFSAYIIVILKFSSYIPCSCGGILQSMSWKQHLFFNVGFVLLGAVAILIHPNQNHDLIAIGGKAEPLNK